MLQKIFETKREEVDASRRKIPIEEMVELSDQVNLNHRFQAALEANRGPSHPVNLIAEVKKASPSQGIIRSEFNPSQIASQYQQAGADALSVLTDETYFQGSLANLQIVRAQCSLPILRKDFVYDAYQVYESKAFGADAILLIVAGLQNSQLSDLYGLATKIGLDVLVEVHSEEELEPAMTLKAPIIGVNNRDLSTFKVDLAVSEKLIPLLGNSTLVVCESALSTHSDVKRAEAAGAKAVLIGTAFCGAQNIQAKVKEVMGW